MDETQPLDSDAGLSKGLGMGVHCRQRRKIWGSLGRVWGNKGEKRVGG